MDSSHLQYTSSHFISVSSDPSLRIHEPSREREAKPTRYLRPSSSIRRILKHDSVACAPPNPLTTRRINMLYEAFTLQKKAALVTTRVNTWADWRRGVYSRRDREAKPNAAQGVSGHTPFLDRTVRACSGWCGESEIESACFVESGYFVWDVRVCGDISIPVCLCFVEEERGGSEAAGGLQSDVD